MTSMPDTLAALRERIATQAGTIAMQAEVIAQLRDDLAPLQDFDQIGRFSLHQKLILATLMRWNIATYDKLLHVLYAGRVGDEPGQNVLKVQVCLLRTKLASHGITIENSRELGYRMPAADKARLRVIMAGVSA